MRVEVEQRRVLRSIQRLLTDYKNAHKGPTVILVQTQMSKLQRGLVGVTEFDVQQSLSDNVIEVMIQTIRKCRGFPVLGFEVVY